jgi:addiction module RelB/DinJ family antitoxin
MGYSVILEERIMEKAETIRARVEAKLKADAEAVLDKLGLTASDAIRLFYKQVALRWGLPFGVVSNVRPFDATRLPTVVCGDNVTPSRIASHRPRATEA